MDTTSTAMARTLHLLATKQDIQDKLRNEIIDARKALGNLDYDQLVSLPYLDAVCRETLRLYVFFLCWLRNSIHVVNSLTAQTSPNTCSSENVCRTGLILHLNNEKLTSILFLLPGLDKMSLFL